MKSQRIRVRVELIEVDEAPSSVIPLRRVGPGEFETFLNAEQADQMEEIEYAVFQTSYLAIHDAMSQQFTKLAEMTSRMAHPLWQSPLKP